MLNGENVNLIAGRFNTQQTLIEAIFHSYRLLWSLILQRYASKPSYYLFIISREVKTNIMFAHYMFKELDIEKE